MNKPRKPLVHHLRDYFFPHPHNNYRPHLFSITSVAVLVLAVVVFEAGYLVQTKFVFFRTDFLASVLPGALVALTNQDRALQGLAGVTEDPLLDRAAQAAALDMATNGYFAHVSPDGKTPWYWLDQVGYRYSYAGENLAVNFSDSENVETAWMESPTHRANIMKPQYTQVGFGTANGMYEGRETTFVVEFFATPAATETKTAQASATLALSSPAEPTQSSTTSMKVLGSQTDEASANITSPSWLAKMLASPQHTLASILTILFSIIAISLIVVFFVRGRTQHHSVIIGSIVLFVCIAGALIISLVLAGTVQLNSGTQTSVVVQ
ncbi:MAG: CAP domain-containing protein [Candidatus Kaiserbacteria bacterium]|nr:CAP domain-containing protein [Candidatus Kaiserbacteria bacterium]